MASARGMTEGNGRGRRGKSHKVVGTREQGNLPCVYSHTGICVQNREVPFLSKY